MLQCLIEGCSLRSTSRMVDVSINTVTKFLEELGTACAFYQAQVLHDLPCKRIQADEIWSFVGSKAKNTPKGKREEAGDVWTWVALCADTKLAVSWTVGDRTAVYAHDLMQDVANRLKNRVQLTTDGHKAYLNAVEDAFGSNVDYAMLVKLYGEPKGSTAERKYSPGECCGAIKGVICGNPKEFDVSTSFVERQNLTMRMGMRRFTRLTNGFSRKIANHEHAIGIHYLYYNFGRIHKTLRVTPAMEARVCDHVWTLEDIAKLAE